MNPKPYIIVQARMGSERLPGKVLKRVLDKALLEFEIERLKRVKNSAGLLVATSGQPSDDVIEDFCTDQNILVYRGSEKDLLKRYLGAADFLQAESVVRVTGDCPLIDPAIVDQVIEVFQNQSADYASNVVERRFPRGMDCEVVKVSALKKIEALSNDAAHREHVTQYILQNREEFKIASLLTSQGDHHQLRLTVDTSEDFLLIRMILEDLYPRNPHFSLADILQLLSEHPDWTAINAHIEQKKV